MTLRVIEGFDFMPSGLTATAREILWGAKHYFFHHGIISVVPDVGTGRFGFGKAWYSTTTNISNFTDRESHVIPLGLNCTEGVIGVAVYRDSQSQNACSFVSFYNGVWDTPQLTICLFLNGVIQVRRGDHKGTIIQTSISGAFYEDRWFYLEVKAGINDIGGYCQVRVNTEIVIDIPDADTQMVSSTNNFDCIQIGWGTYSTNEKISFYFDDLYFVDLLGTENNDFLGNVRIKSQFVTGNGANIDFSIGGTSPAATNWQSVLNANLDDTKYVYSPNVGDYDLYTIEAIVNSPVVYGVQVSSAARQDDATQRNLHNQLRTAGAVLDEGDNHFINQKFSFYKDIWELNPETGVGWTGTEVNALQIGPKVAG